MIASVVLLVVALSLMAIRAPILLWTVVLGVILIIFTVFISTSLFILLPAWLMYLAATLFAVAKKQRIQYFTTPLVHRLEATMPSISKTEREAIEAGDVWWEKELFCGRPDWKKLLTLPKPTLTQEEQDFLDNQVETICSMLNDWQIVTEDHDLPKEAWEYLKKERFFGMVIPQEYGGRGFSALAHSTVIAKIATCSISAAVDTMVPNSLGPGELLLHYGTPAQKNYYLPRLARGEDIPCFALTGPEAGSDAGSITDSGVVCYGQYQDKKIVGIRLSWDKRYITLAPVATVLGVAFRLYDPDHLLGKREDIGITLCLIPTSHPGVEIGHRHLPLHLAFMNGPTRGHDVFIPLDWVIGGEEMAGKGWKMLMECLSIGRAISLPALSTACGKLSFRMTGAYARIRKQFNTPIAQFEGIEEALGHIAGYTYLLEATRLLTAGAVDLKIRPSIASAIAKYHMTELGRRVIKEAMDIHAGQMIQVGPRNYLANAHISIPISITVEGANILTRNLIIFGQGAIRCHPYILNEINLINSKEEKDKTKKIDSLIMGHIGYALSNFVRTLWMSLTGGLLVFSPVKGPTAPYYRQLTRMSAALALLADVSMLSLGGKLKRKERISARLGDILSQLYLASATLKYFHDHQEMDTDLDFVRWNIETCLYHIQVACDTLLHNFPIKWLGKLLYVLIFPFGAAYRQPKDKLHHNIVKTMLVPSEFRDRLTQYSYLGHKIDDPKVRLETALKRLEEIDPITKKFQAAIKNGIIAKRGNFNERIQAAVTAGIISKEEANTLLDFDVLQKEIIKVNEFSFDLSSVIT